MQDGRVQGGRMQGGRMQSGRMQSSLLSRSRVREGAGWLTAAAIALIVAAQVASTARAEFIFRDGDSVAVAMFVRSVFDGQPLDWAMSSVLFIPESAMFAALSILPLDANALLAINAVLNLLALYGALRLVAGRRRDGSAPVAWSLVALAVFGVIALTELSPSRDGFELASLMATTTYYSATVVAVIASVGIVRRALDRPEPGRVLPIALFLVSTISTLSNPLYGAWATAPLTLLLAILALRTGRRRTSIVLAVAACAGSILAMLLRIPLDPWIAKTGASYIRPQEWMDSLAYYGGHAVTRMQSPLGVVAAAILLALTVYAVVQTVRLREPGARLVAASAWLLPVLVVVGGIALGTHAARYLQPAVFAPLLALLAAPRLLTLPRPRWLLAAGGAVLLAGSIVSVPRLAAAAERPDADLACVTGWIDEADRVGGGQFWTTRLPKLHLDDTTRLVQLHADLHAYPWLVNRTDYDGVTEVSFLIEDAQSGGWALPADAEPDAIVTCGRYRILDFAEHPLPIGPPLV